ncbi:hypothetical protein BGZ83_006098 [Gryganskiella cystojenkinii]|nr:hypothetical protein BGZ83_006098 [Gryganskiella cystojenkinii]
MAAPEVNPASGNSTSNIATTQDKSLEVGMAFAHEYYTYLNKKPLRVHLFYKENSTMSHGFQGEEVETCIGQQAIKTKIQDLDFEDCKVLVSNVDCQGSFGGGIILQVLGELSNRGGPAQKFVQTFFLAEQPKGYYVLNDIFRYLKEDLDDEEDGEEAVVAEQESAQDSASAVTAASVNPVVNAAGTAAQDHIDQTTPENGDIKASIPAEAAPDVAAATEETVTKTQVQESQPQTASPSQKKPMDKKVEKKHPIERKQTEKKADRKEVKPEDSIQEKSAVEAISVATTADSPLLEAVSVTPSSPADQTTVTPAPAQPPKAPTWANLAANKSTQWSQVAAPKPGAVAHAPTTTAGPAAAPTPKPQTPSHPQQSQQQQQRPQGYRPSGREEYHSIYIKNVTDRMSLDQLRAAFSKFGVVTHLELTLKKNCAFLDFSTPEAMNAALRQNTVPVGNEVVLAEERRRGNHNNSSNGPRQFHQGQGQGQGPQGNIGPRGPRPTNQINNSTPRGAVQQDRKNFQQNNKAPAVAAK